VRKEQRDSVLKLSYSLNAFTVGCPLQHRDPVAVLRESVLEELQLQGLHCLVRDVKWVWMLEQGRCIYDLMGVFLCVHYGCSSHSNVE
jgi:hypothetical protein